MAKQRSYIPRGQNSVVLEQSGLEMDVGGDIARFPSEDPTVLAQCQRDPLKMYIKGQHTSHPPMATRMAIMFWAADARQLALLPLD